MPNINYLDILKKAWEITWKNKFLWWFGFLISLAGASNFRYNFGPDELSSSQQDKMADFFSQNISWIIPLVIAVIILGVVFYVLSLISQAGIIKSILSVIKNEPASFKKGFKEGKKYFWRLLGVNFLLGLLILLFVVIGIIPSFFLFVNEAIVAGAILLIITILILIPIIIFAVYTGRYAHIYIVAGELSFWDAIENGYNLFSKNIWASIIMSLFFIPINIVLFLLFLGLLIPLVIIFGLMALVVYFILGWVGVAVVAALGGLVFLAGIMLISSIYQTFSQASWILFFDLIAKPKVPEEAIKEEVLEAKPESLPMADPIKTAELKE